MNSDKIVSCDVIRYDAVKNIFVDDKKLTSVEKLFELRLNGKHFRNIFCTPENIEDLTVGILAQAEKIFLIDDVINITINDSKIEVETKLKLAPAQKNFSNVKFVARDILNCADKLLGEMSTTHDKTNGTHSGILFDGKNILIFREDIGRHNVFDKIYGAALRQNIFLGDKALIFSGRCSSEMIIKVARMNIPVVVAKSVPTTYSINIAKKFGVTLAGRLTADSFCIYSNPERIVLS
ncbi:MAG: formate dehydrogenase accessory sulfurtransferase FdhD [Selenomonadaceae bacterium]|nr:formate dehydrogenase accessory sulfurtransferase FdhD [Selenomonadaceae bacterium]